MNTQLNRAFVLPTILILVTSGGAYNLPQPDSHTVSRYNLDIVKNGSFTNRETGNLGRMVFPPRADRKATSAPLWLTQRMNALLKMPPPTLDEILMQFNASMAVRKKSIDRAAS